MELKKIFNAWAQDTDKRYIKQQWLLSKWEVVEGIVWPQEKIDLMLKSIREGLKLEKEHHLIDLGCGGGWITQALRPAGNDVMGLDISQAMLTDYAVELNPNVPFLCGDIGQLPFKNETFDRVLSYYVFLNFGNFDFIKQAIGEILRVLKKDGVALIGQLAEERRSADYDKAKEEYLAYCRKEYQLGDSIQERHPIPVCLINKEKLMEFLTQAQIPFTIRDSFNPFYRPGAPQAIDWRFDVVLEKV